MVSGSDFAFDHRRVTGALALEPAHFSEFQRLAKTVRFGPGFQFLILEFNDVAYRTQLVAAIDDLLRVEAVASQKIDLMERGFADVADFETAIRLIPSVANTATALHVFGGEAWFDEARIEAFNIRREAFSQLGPIKMLLWLTIDVVAKIAKRAPDLWAWRGSVVFSFVRATRLEASMPSSGMRAIDTRALAERGRRIAELRADLRDGAVVDDLRAPLLDELAGLLESLGDLDEALRIRKEEQLPVYEKLGDVRSRAVTMGQIADILEARGDLDEALRIRKEEQLPVYEKLGDVRSRAVTMGKIADILKARGDLDEALRIRKEEELPVYEKLGDVRSRAVTMGKIADILKARGDLDEALRIRKEEQLPVYEKLGDVRERLITEAQLGQLYVLKGEPERARGLWLKALADAQWMRIPEARIIEGWLKDL